MDTVVRTRVERYLPSLRAEAVGRVLLLGDVWPERRSRAGPSDPSVDHRRRVETVGDLAGPYDSIVSAGALFQAAEPQEAMAEVRRLLAAEGLLVFLEPTADALRGAWWPRLAHDITALLWEEGFSVIEARRFSLRGEWGIPWSLVRGRARHARGRDGAAPSHGFDRSAAPQ